MTVSIEVFLNPFAKGLAKMLPNEQIIICDGIINFRLIRVPVISVRHFCLIKPLAKAFRETSNVGSNICGLWLFTIAFSFSGGSRISRRGRGPRRGGMDSRGGHVSKILYVKTKESGPFGGACPAHAPSRSTNEF